ncbi:MAG: acyltransferase family protein [Actinomycetaceae bacterium]|nr:acyltransferase family protein [Actinomycetaceae bacterium]MDU0970344.1 acyltransferase family protein [Actinomycetaceae bacterium]
MDRDAVGGRNDQATTGREGAGQLVAGTLPFPDPADLAARFADRVSGSGVDAPGHVPAHDDSSAATVTDPSGVPGVNRHPERPSSAFARPQTRPQAHPNPGPASARPTPRPDALGPTTPEGTDAGTLEAPKRRFHLRGLDGLRAIACIGVVLYHFFPRVMPGGFLGVDVFFVLSGFLITGLLIEERRSTGRISLTQFWLRRVRRLFPAILTMILLTVPVTWLISRDLLVGIRSQVVGALAFVYNWVTIASGATYFAQQTPRLYMNVWSLSVEEQFYLFWPLILVALFAFEAKLRGRRMALVPWLLALVSILIMQGLVIHGAHTGAADPTRAYMGTDSHSFGLMLGAGLALYMRRPLAPAMRRLTATQINVRGLISWAGLVVIIITFFVIPDDAGWTYPWGCLIACLGVVAFLQGCVDEVAGRVGPSQALVGLVDVAPARWVGQRSYGIYLWHWPVIVLLEAMFPQARLGVMALVASALSVGLAAASYTLVETPMRRNGFVATVRSWVMVEPGRGPKWHVLVPLFAVLVTIPLTLTAIIVAPSHTELERRLTAIAQHKSATPTPSPTKKPAPTHAKVAPVTGANVTMVGDSVMLGAKPDLDKALPGAIVDGEVSRSMKAAGPIIASYAKDGERPYLVVALATNTAVTKEQLDGIMKQVAPTTRVVLVNAYGPARCTWIPGSNHEIDEALKRYPDRIRVANWHDAIAAHPEWLGPDATHPEKAEGNALYAQVVTNALASFATSR